MANTELTMISVIVAYALPEKQYVFPIKVPTSSTVEDAIVLSKILQLRPEIDLSQTKVGIFSRIVKLQDTLNEGDRVEIYRPLIADPKVLRRQRAERSRSDLSESE